MRFTQEACQRRTVLTVGSMMTLPFPNDFAWQIELSNQAIGVNREVEKQPCYLNVIYPIPSVLTPWSRGLPEKLTCLSHSRNYSHFMEPEGSLHQQQQPATCPYPEPHRSSPFHFWNIHFNIILPLTPGSFKWSLSLRFLQQNLFPHTCYVPCPTQWLPSTFEIILPTS